MACYFLENVHTTSFTPKEYQVELLDAGRIGNTIVCLHSGPNKTFTVLKLLQELSTSIRKPWDCGGKRSLYIGNTRNVNYYSDLIQQLTDLSVGKHCSTNETINFIEHQVLAVTSDVCVEWVKSGQICWSKINLIVLEDCHNVLKNNAVREIILNLKESYYSPRLLGLTSPLFTSNKVKPGAVEAQVKQLEKDLNSKVETASDIVAILRFNVRPKEVLLVCDNYQTCELSEILANEMYELREFLDDHRFDPTEIYDDTFADELKEIPDPKKDPYEIIDNYLEVLNSMGPWCADKAAFVLLVHIEKLKVKTPYERHFLLLCLTSSVLLKLRAICDCIFQNLSETEQIYRYSSPKVLRLIEVVRQFKPNKPVECENSTETTDYNCVNKLDNKLCDNIEKADAINKKSKNNDANKLLLTEKSLCHHNNTNNENEPKDNVLYNNTKNNSLTVNDQVINGVNIPPKKCFICSKNACSQSKDVDQNDIGISTNGTDNLLLHENGSCKDINIRNSEPVENGTLENCTKNSCQGRLNDNIKEINALEIPENEKDLNKLPSNKSATINGCNENKRWRGKGRGWRQRKGAGTANNKIKHQLHDDADNLCGIIFVEKRFTAKILFHLFLELHKNDTDFDNITTQYTVGKVLDPTGDSREAEVEHKKQEEVLKRFRMRECNLVVATSVLEEGIELPKCNLVVRFDPVSNYKSHAYSKGRAKQQLSYYISLVEQKCVNEFLQTYAQYICTEQLLLKRSTNHESTEEEENEANMYTHCVPAYKPLEDGPSVDMATSIAVINRYCAKLPSDTFTRLTPMWSLDQIIFKEALMYYCTVRLPINSPLKQDVLGHPMPTKVLAQRIAALETCRLLHLKGELDNNLEPVGKEAYNVGSDDGDLTPITFDPNLPRPGTTKSRQYYYKRIASCLNDCRPVAGVKCFLYNIDLFLTCPLPEEQNTRGRKLHPPELASQAFGILTLKEIPKVCPFPIFTRSGEVQVSFKLCSTAIVLSERNVETISTFLNFIFTSVLRLQKYLMSFDPEAKENSFFIVPTKRINGRSEVDWDFLEVIYSRKDESPHLIPDEDRKNFEFDPEKYEDAVVMPWYRNQDQPQYFYVAEICHHLNPKSGFPGSYYKTFEDYYHKKYSIQIQNTSQPLLDVDHTSARLNFLTPRYVNRKGVALPTSSEETKRAKRENLEQKQILVGELCQIHVVPASLWRQAVCLPCILYRLNALLLADEIRTKVASEIRLGLVNLPPDFEWAPLDFGWSLADVLKKSNQQSDKKQIEKKEVDLDLQNASENNTQSSDDEASKSKDLIDDKDSDDLTDEEDVRDIDDLTDEEDKKPDDWMEIGTWSNDMAQLDGLSNDLPPELSMVRYGSPTSWDVAEQQSYDYYSSDCESDGSDEAFLESENSESSEAGAGRLKITFRGDYLAEAIEDDNVQKRAVIEDLEQTNTETWCWDSEDLIPEVKEDIEEENEKFNKATLECVEMIKQKDMLISAKQPFTIDKDKRKRSEVGLGSEHKNLPFNMDGYGMPKDLVHPSSADFSTPLYSLSENKFEESFEESTFSFDAQPELEGHPGPSPSILLQALTMSNANDGINLERLETIGDSFLKYAITTYLYRTRESIHEGKLSHLRSKQVSNLKLYRLGQKKVFGESMIASKFEPHDNWLPPCYLVPRDAEQQLLDSEPQATLPYNLVTQHSIPDKSIADCVEALIGAYLIECGPRGALLFMSWLGIKVIPKVEEKLEDSVIQNRPVGSYVTDSDNPVQIVYTELSVPESPLLRHVPDPEGELATLLSGFESLEASLQYSFRDKSYLLQAMSHASYSPNRITDCYQRLEFLGDAVLDYLITRHLFEDKRAHSPGALTDLRSALVNNTIFASLAVKHGLHKYFRHLSPGLAEVVQRFVTIQEENSHSIMEEFYLIGEEAEDVEVPKALGDVFESIAGAIFLDSGMSLDTVWKVYYRMMKKEIEQFSTKVPKSPIRELLELEPETAKFSKPEKLADGRRVRVTVEVFGKGTFKGIGRNYRIAKCTAAKCALKQLKVGLLARKFTEYPSSSFLKVLRACQDGKTTD